MQLRHSLVRVLPAAAASLICGLARAQCPPQWSAVPATGGAVYAFATMPNGDLIAAGSFTRIGGVPARGVARRVNGTWTPLGTGIAGIVRAVAALPDGSLVAGGSFGANVAIWDGTSWAPLGGGVSGSAHSAAELGVHCLLQLPNGDLLVGGHFTTAGSMQTYNIARWNGSSWSTLGAGLPGGSYHGLPGVVAALARLPNGDVAAGGTVLGGEPAVARWDGGGWQQLGTWLPCRLPVSSLLVTQNGDLYGGSGLLIYADSPFVCRWTGTTWTPLPAAMTNGGYGAGTIRALAELPNGDLVAGGTVGVLGASSNQVVRWDGTAWRPVGTVSGSVVMALSMLNTGQLVIGGEFAGVGGVAAPNMIELGSTCAAAVTPVGAGCAGAAGVHTLTANSLPWLGSTFRATTTAVATSAFALAITSPSPNTIPLADVLPIAGPDCVTLQLPALSNLLLPVHGRVVSELPLPEVPHLIGISLFHNVVVLQLDTSGTAISASSTQSLMLQLGGF